MGDIGIWIAVKFVLQAALFEPHYPVCQRKLEKTGHRLFIYLLLTAAVEGIGYALNPDNYLFRFGAGNFAVLFSSRCCLYAFPDLV